MSSENEEKRLPDEVIELDEETRRKPRISYTRDFLLSLSDLDICKKLPSGFDLSLMSDLHETPQDRQRTSGGLGLNSFRRSNEYGSSPPTRGDSSSYSRGIQGRWDSRSSGRSDKDSDSQSDWDADSSKRYGNQSKRSWQGPEHDGLLGSGSFPRPSGYTAGGSAPKPRPNEHYQLNRSSEPYQPPRPYKAVPHSRRDTDTFNNETFGSSESTSDDRAEEERKRRASFELMRKEQHKSFQDKQKLNIEKNNKDDFDISTLMEESKDEKMPMKRGSESEELVIPATKDNGPDKSSAPSQALASRPLVPPGFTSAAVERSSGPKSFSHSRTTQAEIAESENNLLEGKSSSVHTTSDDQEEIQLGFRKPQRESLSSRTSINNHSGSGLDLTSVLDVSNQTVNVGSSILSSDKTSITQTLESSKSGEVSEHNVASSILGNSNHDRSSTSILDKLFSSSLPLNDTTSSSAAVEHHDSKVDETWALNPSSKFARWFNEEEKKPTNDPIPGQRDDLLSLIVGDKGGSRVSGNNNDTSVSTLPNLLAFQNSESVDRLVTSDVVSTNIGSFNQLHKENKPEPVAAVITCEDLEQSMLSEVGIDGPISQPPPVHNWTNPNGKTKQPNANTDNVASQHLLSLLQMGSGMKASESSLGMDTFFPDNVHGAEEPSIGTVQNSREAKVKKGSESSNSLTLETLFGSAFMKELQSVGAPVSSQRGSAGSTKLDVSESHGFPFPVPNNHETGLANKRKQDKGDRIEEPWLSHQAPLQQQVRTIFGPKVGGSFNSPADARLPEDDSLIMGNDSLSFESFVQPIKKESLPSSNAQLDLAEKLAAFNINTAHRDERLSRGGSQELPFHRNPYQNLNAQQSFHQQLNNMGTSFPRMDSRPMNINNSQMKFMGTDHEPVPNHGMQMNMLRPPFPHQPSSGPSGFDQSIAHHPMLQQMHMQGNFPANLLQGPRGQPSMSPHPNRSAPMHAHPNLANLGMPPQSGTDASGGTSNHPEALQRLLEMELRSKNPKQMHPFAGGGGGQSHGSYGHELDMGFGFR